MNMMRKLSRTLCTRHALLVALLLAILYVVQNRPAKLDTKHAPIQTLNRPPFRSLCPPVRYVFFDVEK